MKKSARRDANTARCL